MSTMSNLAFQPLYDKIGATYDATRRAEPEILDVLAKLLDLKGGADVLDIGCGTGNYTTALGDQYDFEMLGLDRSGLMLRTARAKAPGLRLVGADAANLPFPNRSFDGAICTLAIHHFDDLEASFAEAARVLDRGRLVIFTALPEQIKRYWLSAYFPDMMAEAAETMPDWNTV